MQVVLVMFRAEGDRRSFSITRDVTVIGRREDCDFRIPLGEISRKHCRLIKEPDSFRVEDLGSSNGTFHNGQRIQEATLQAGDTVQVGSVVFVVQIDGTPADDQLQPLPAARSSRTTDVREEIPPEDVTTAAASNNGEFDPMAILENHDSDVPQDAMIVDLDESGHDEPA